VGTQSVNADYVRAIEKHVCLKNDGHLIRIVGPAFEIVSRWERDGVPLKVALRGIDRYFERYYRNGPKRRPVRVEFCDTDVLEVFDEWRRAVGVTGRPEGKIPTSDTDPPSGGHRGPSLASHLERVLLKLSSARAIGRLGDDVDTLIDRVSAELDQARAHARGLRGDARRQLLQRLASIDREMLDAVAAALPVDVRERIEADTDDMLSAYRDQMAVAAFARARQAAIDQLIREHASLPTIAIAG
jgi:hypothetical protein